MNDGFQGFKRKKKFLLFCLYCAASSCLAHFCSSPFSGSVSRCRTPTGLAALASASYPTISMTIRVRVDTVAHILLTRVEPQACMAVRDVLSASFSAYCSVPCIPLQSPGRCIDTAPLRVLVKTPKCVEIDAWATVSDTVIHRSPTLHKVNGKRIHYYGQG